jgi:CDGSH-type Zn-finger protein
MPVPWRRRKPGDSMSEALPKVAQRGPYEVAVKAGESYWWCACGLSAKQPFCDGSHKGTEFKSLKFTADKDETVYLCGCKATAGQPFCDGRHNSL